MLAGSAVRARGVGRCALLCLLALLPASAAAQAVAGGHSHTLFATPSGDLYAWGWNNAGQIGDGTTANRPAPALVLTDVAAVAAGLHHSVALKIDGTVWTWGSGSYGELGHGTYSALHVPTQVQSLTGVAAIVAGQRFTIALKSDGTVWAWGLNNTGQLGDGTTTIKPTPTLVSGLTGIVGIAAREGHTLALTSTGNVYAWGANNQGQLGDGTKITRTIPVLASALSDVVEISAGNLHSLARTTSGAVYAWGVNWSGRLGTGDTTGQTTPTLITQPGDVRWLTAGGNTSHATLIDGDVKGWGSNSNGEIGDGTTSSRTVPAAALTPPSVMLLESGGSHSVAVTDTGEVWSWGLNSQGQLGDGTTTTRTTPVRIAEAGYSWPVAPPTFSVPAGTYTNVVNVMVASATADAEIHYTLDGSDPTTTDSVITAGLGVEIDDATTLKARAWKEGKPTSTITSATYVFAAANPTFSPAPSTYPTPKVVSLASQTAGATIHFTLDGSVPTTAAPVYSAPIDVDTTTIIRAVAVRGSWTPSSAVTGTFTMNFGTLAAPTISPAAGSYDGQVVVTMTADPSATIRYTTNGASVTSTSPIYTGPLAIEATSAIRAKAFRVDHAASSQTSVAYTITVQAPQLTPAPGTYPAGQVITLQSPTPGSLVHYTLDGTTPTTSSPVAPLAGIVAGDFTLKAFATKPGATASAVVSGAYQVSGTLGSPRVAAGDMHSLAVRSDGVVWSWGNNGWGQLADGTTFQRNLPVVSGGLSGIVAAATGDSHSLAIRSDGSVVGWGSNAGGQLGDGTTTARKMPVVAQGVTQAIDVEGGANHSLALRADGTVWTWGRNAEGQLGDGSTTQRLNPVPITALIDVTDIGAGYAHSIALRSDGSVWTWGANGNGQLGHGDQVSRSSPAEVAGAAGAIAVSAGAYHSVALLSDGTVRTWGHNASGQLGDGTTTQQKSPVVVPGLTSVTAIAAGTQHTMALASDGTVWAWGQNMNGQVGDGSGLQRNAPVAIQGMPPIAAIAAGGQHSLAVASDGSVWAWGRNYYGAVGDGTTTNRLSPVQIADGDMNWSVPAPVLSVASGTYSAPQTVTVTSQAAGATLYYTADGTEPNQTSTTIASGGSIPISVSTTLKARAYAPGAAASGVVVGTYVLRPAAPTFTPAAGTYTSAQNVTIATATPDTTIRYTLDGSMPTEASATYETALVIDSTQTLSAVAFRAGWSPSSVASAAYTMNFGTLATPAISPAAGLYEYGQLVTMSAEAGSEIRYTTNGSVPGPSSPLYQGPFALQTAATVTARAFRTNFTPSAAAANAYTLRANAPVFSPGSGTHSPSQTIAMLSGTPGVTIHYTTTGADPTLSDPSVTNGSTIPMGTFTLKARAFHGSMVASDAATSEYMLDGCAVSLSETSIARSATAGGGVISVTTTGTSCAWAVTSDAAWLVPGVTGGTDSGVATYTIAHNISGAGRSATLTIGGQVVSIVQSAEPSCSIQVGPLNISAPAEGAAGHISITTTDDHCTWLATSSSEWITLGRASTPGAYAAGVLADQPTGFWRLDEPSGTVAHDSTSYERDGTFAGSLTFGVPSGLGDHTTAVGFDGATAYVEIPHDASFDTAAVSWEAWVLVDAVASEPRRLFGRGTDAFSVSVEPGDTRLTISWKLASGAVEEVEMQTPIVGLGWKHFVFTHDGAGWHGYLDGILDSSGSAGGPLQGDAEAIRFGRAVASADWFEGGLDDVALYPYALSAAQVSHHFAISSRTGLGSVALPYTIVPNDGQTARGAVVAIADSFVDVSQAADGLSAPPTITAKANHPPNVAGWYNSDVAVAFTCADDEGVEFCTPETSVTGEGEVLSATGVARDADGNETTTTLPFKIDRTPPALTLMSPADGDISASSALTLEFSATDVLSGLAAVRCGRTSATVSAELYSCSVSLRPGRNLIHVTAKDLAGNVATIVFTHTRSGAATRLLVSPGITGLVVGETQRVSVQSDDGFAVTANWSSDDPSIAVAEAEGGQTVIRAVGPGTTTLTASSSLGLAGTITATVYANAAQALGTVKWSLASGSEGALVQTDRVSPDDPDFIGVRNDTDETTTLFGVDADGVRLWQQTIDGSASAVADASGGLLLMTEDGLTRLPLSSGGSSWHVDVNGAIAQAPDGTVYATHSEQTDDGGGRSGVFVIDGDTGTVRRRIWLPRSSGTMANHDCTPGLHFSSESSPQLPAPVVGADGRAYIPFGVHHSYYNYLPCGSGSGHETSESYVLRVAPDGDSDRFQVASSSGWNISTGVGAAVPDSDGRVIVPVYKHADFELVSTQFAQFSDFGMSLSTTAGPSGVFAAGDLGRVFAGGDGGTSALSTSGSQLWTVNLGEFAAATRDGGAVFYESGALHVVTPDGVVSEQVPVPSSYGYMYWMNGLWLAMHSPTTMMVRGPVIDESPFTWFPGIGNAQQQRAPTRPTFSHIVPVDVLAPLGGDSYLDASFAQDMSNATSANHTFAFQERANLNNFYAEVQRKISAFGFIGHSISNPMPDYTSVGIRLYMRYLIKRMTPQVTGHEGGLGDTYEDVIPTAATVVFVASCLAGQTFQSLWGIDDNTNNRALIVPDMPMPEGPNEFDVDLYWGAQAWIRISAKLSAGAKVHEAVLDANNYLAQNMPRFDSNGNPIPLLSFKAIGDNDVSIR